jgi:pyruvate/2-oxoglutarate dehydrogenase complex dihydrolipoamide acyltransferase (E2) component
MPILGADMQTGTLIAWRKQPGDAVRHGDIIAEVESDKADVEVEIFMDGVIEKILVEPGEVPVGTPLASSASRAKRRRRTARLPPPTEEAPPVVARRALPVEGERARFAGGEMLAPSWASTSRVQGRRRAALASRRRGGRAACARLRRRGGVADRGAHAPGHRGGHGAIRARITLPRHTTIDRNATAWLAGEARPMPSACSTACY